MASQSTPLTSLEPSCLHRIADLENSSEIQWNHTPLADASTLARMSSPANSKKLFQRSASANAASRERAIKFPYMTSQLTPLTSLEPHVPAPYRRPRELLHAAMDISSRPFPIQTEVGCSTTHTYRDPRTDRPRVTRLRIQGTTRKQHTSKGTTGHQSVEVDRDAKKTVQKNRPSMPATWAKSAGRPCDMMFGTHAFETRRVLFDRVDRLGQFQCDRQQQTKLTSLHILLCQYRITDLGKCSGNLCHSHSAHALAFVVFLCAGGVPRRCFSPGDGSRSRQLQKRTRFQNDNRLPH